jgi:nucleoside-diphosphate-sugar epimerase
MRICILGGRGTVGGLLTKRLSTIHEVTSITRDQVNLIDADAVGTFFSNNSFDVVINSAIIPTTGMDAPKEVTSTNLAMFYNMYAHREKFGRVIHFCSGAEFDTRNHISNAPEELLFKSEPIDPYGISKNSTARISYVTDNFYNIRLFGVFYPTELPRRLLRLIADGKPVSITDKYFDFLYLEDLVPLVKYYINTPIPKYKDVNVVYEEKILLSEFVRKFVKLNELDVKIPIELSSGLDYTGDGSKFRELDLPILGQDFGLKNYITHLRDQT